MKRCLGDLSTNQPAKKRKIDTNPSKQAIQKILTDPSDYKRYEDIYQTLCNVLKFDDIDILSQIALFATGNIETCNVCNTEILELQSEPFNSTYMRNKGRDGTHSWISEHIYCVNCANNVADDNKEPGDYENDNVFFHCESTQCKPGYYPKTEIIECDSYILERSVHSICKECITNIPLTICNNGCGNYLHGGKGPTPDIFLSYERCETCKQMICPLCSNQAIHPDAEPEDLKDTSCDGCGEYIECYNCAKCSCSAYFGGYCGLKICPECREDDDTMQNIHC